MARCQRCFTANSNGELAGVLSCDDDRVREPPSQGYLHVPCVCVGGAGYDSTTQPLRKAKDESANTQGSSVQLPSYNMGKSLLVEQGWKDNSFATYLVASMVSGVSVCAAMQPADTVLTRMYNREFRGWDIPGTMSRATRPARNAQTAQGG